MATCRPPPYCIGSSEKAAPCYHSSPSSQISIDPSQTQDLYIDVDLAQYAVQELMPASYSHDFEFSMPDARLLQPAAQLAPADELFYKGQLLPLQPDVRLSIVHTGYFEEAQPVTELISSRLSTILSVGNQDLTSIPSRMGLDASLADFRSSGFRCQSSGCLECSNVKDEGDYSGSSRDSSGSSRDLSFFTPDQEGRELAAYHEPGQTTNFSAGQYSSRRPAFKWKHVFDALKTAPKVLLDGRKEQSKVRVTHSADLGRQNPSDEKSSLLWSSRSLPTLDGASKAVVRETRGSKVRSSAWDIKKNVKGMREEGRNNVERGAFSGMNEEMEREKHISLWHHRGAERWREFPKKLMRPRCQKNLQEQKGKGLLGQFHENLGCSSSRRSIFTMARRPASTSPEILISKGTSNYSRTTSTVNELHSAVQSAIAHCKRSIASQSSEDH